MARSKKLATPAKSPQIRILADGVFVDDGERKDSGDTVTASPEIAAILIERGLAEYV